MTPPTPTTEQQQALESMRMQEVLLLLQNLAQRENETIKTILGRLYDVGSIRLIDQDVGQRYLRRPLKGIASVSKPVFSAIAIRWFHKNCPTLIADWLYSQVTFQDSEPDPELTQPVQTINAAVSQIDAQLQPQTAAELRLSPRKLYWLTGLCASAIFLSGCLGFWLGHRFGADPIQFNGQNPFNPSMEVNYERPASRSEI